MRAKKTLTAIIVVLLIITTPAFAANYTRAYLETVGEPNIGFSLLSPMRNANDVYISIYPDVNSKNNQPRNVSSSSSNPHKGADLNMSAGAEVYPIAAGTVTGIHRSDTDQDSYIVITSNVNNVVFETRYMHLYPENLSINDTVGVYDLIGTIMPYITYPPHLHLQIRQATGNHYTLKLFPFFRNISQWNYGYDLDYMAGLTVSNAGILNITGYTYSDGVRYALDKVELYYKIGQNGSWSGPISNTSHTNYKYSFDLHSISGFSPGSTLYYYLAGIRGSDIGYNVSYKHGIFPQYYSQPALPIPASYADQIALTYTRP